MAKRIKAVVRLQIPAGITIYEDRSFTFITKTPPVTDLLKKVVGVEKGSANPNKIKVGTIDRAKLREIAELKMKDLNVIDIEGAERMVEGTAQSMGITIE